MDLLSEIGGLFAQQGLYEATLRISVVFVLGGMGELICERAGVMNLGIEGIMVFGALSGFMVVEAGASLWVGLIVAALAGAIAGVVHGFFTVTLGLNQHVTGIALTFFWTGMSFFIFRVMTQTADFAVELVKIDPFHPVAIPILSSIPVLGNIFFNLTPVAYAALPGLIILTYFIYRTPLGLALRSAGENPFCLDSVGINVWRLRIGAVIVGSALMGLAGAYLSTSYFNEFTTGIVAGRGWICIVLVIFAKWIPWRLALGAVLFGLVEAFALRVDILGTSVPSQVFFVLPYVFTLIILIIASHRQQYPQAMLIPFRKGDKV